MLQRIDPNHAEMALPIGQASFPLPFKSGLEYAPPARGSWNIVHTGMLLPQSHEIFVCAAGCLRGVVLTAAEMNAADRFSTVAIRENNVIDGDMEELIIDGVSDIVAKLNPRPAAVLVYTSCIHHFMVCDLDHVYSVLRQRFADVRFTDCYMNPIMRKSGLTPDQLMRRQLYSFLEKRPQDPKAINTIGNDLPTKPSSDFVRLAENAGCTIHDITACSTFDQYLDMGASSINIVTNPAALPAGEELQKRLDQPCLYMPASFSFTELTMLADQLHTAALPLPEMRQAAISKLKMTADTIGHTPVAIDYTAFYRPLQLAKLLLDSGIQVTDVYLDSISEEEKEVFAQLQQRHSGLLLHPTVHPNMRVAARNQPQILAIGQKAAYFTGTSHFVNVVENGGLHGYDGISALCDLIIDAYINPKDASKLITIKGLGAGVCCL